MASKPTSTEELSWRLPLTVAVVSLLVIAFMPLCCELCIFSCGWRLVGPPWFPVPHSREKDGLGASANPPLPPTFRWRKENPGQCS